VHSISVVIGDKEKKNSVKKTTAVNFINNLRTNFSYETSFRQLFSRYMYVKKQRSYEKFVRLCWWNWHLVSYLSPPFQGAHRICENQKPPNSRNKNRQIAEPRLQILESIKNRFSEYILYSVHENIEIVSSMVYSSKIVAFCWIIDIFNFVQFCVLVDFCVFQLKRRNVVVRCSVDFFRLKSQYS